MFSETNKEEYGMGRGSVLVVGVLTFYSDDPTSNPAEAHSYFQ